MSIGYSIQIAKNQKSLTLGFSIQQNRLCDLFSVTELYTIALALFSQVATVFIQ